jgi:hypothetical protein
MILLAFFNLRKVCQFLLKISPQCITFSKILIPQMIAKAL